jgi:hypothetical protein
MPSYIAKTVPLKSCNLSLEDIKKLYRKLSLSVCEAASTDVSSIQQLETTTDEEFAKFKEEVLATYVITVVITGSNGESLVERTEEIFTSPNLPNKIVSIYLDSASAFQARYNVLPNQSFNLTFDFSTPQLIDWQNAVSAPTPNNSVANIRGNNETWVAGVWAKIDEIVQVNRTSRGFLHKSFVYDFGLWLIGVPLAFFITYKLSSKINALFADVHEVVLIAAYFYIFFVAMIAYRLLFGYTKWAFPKVELKDAKNVAKRHRAFWWVIISSLALALLKEAITKLF